MLSKLPWTPKPEIAPRRYVLPKERLTAMVDSVANILRAGSPTLFALEATCRSGVRASLCLGGWPWPRADVVAADVVSRALNRLGARRPTWAQGQPEYVQFGFAAFERTRCLNCGWRLPEGHHKFCGRHCARAFNRQTFEADKKKELAAIQAARRALARECATPKPCELCGALFRPTAPKQRFCSTRCRNRHNAGLQRCAA